MTMFEEARALQGMLSMKKMTQSEIAEMMGTSQSYVANKLRLLKLSDEAQKMILEAGLSERHARALLRIKNEEKLIEMIRKISEMHLTVGSSEALIDAYIEEQTPKELCELGIHSGIERFERIIRDSLLSLKSLGVDVDYRTSFFGNTRYITIAVME